MNDYISRASALSILSDRAIKCAGFYGDLGGACSGAKKLIEAIPAADVRPVVRGKDIWKSHDSHCEFKCSVCGAWAGEVAGGTLDGGPFNFCPSCGAKLEAGE